MAPKQGVRKRPAAGSHETLCDLQPGFLLDEATALDRRALDLQCFTKPLFLAQNQSQFHLPTTPEVELLASALKPDDAAYNLYVGMVTFQPGSCRWTSELQSVELPTGR